MEEEILAIIKNTNKHLTFYEIKDQLGLKTADEYRTLQDTLASMETKAQIYRSKKDRYLLFDDANILKGRLSVNRSGSFGFVVLDGVKEGTPDIRIDEKNMNGANHGDIVAVETFNTKTNEGRVIKIIERDNTDHVGEYYVENGKGYVKMDNPRYKDCFIDVKDSKGAMPGHKVLIKRTKELNKGMFQAEILKIIGHKNDVGTDVLSIVYEYGIPNVFPDEAMDEVEKIQSEVSPEEFEDRRDLRNESIFTIDPDTAKDFDQAITARRMDNGNYHLGVHIADVTHYVKEDSAIGKEDYNRGNSVYLIDRVIPALPHRLSNGICSLNPGVDRLTLSCEMEIDAKGNVVKYDIFPAVINSKKRMTYTDANKILENNEMVEGYESFTDMLKLMVEIGDVLFKRLDQRGYLEFGTEEMEIIVDKDGKPIEITKRKEGIAEKFNEAFMIAANETIGTHFHYLDIPVIYRVHEKPDDKKIKQFINFISSLGYCLKGKIKQFNAKMMQQILKILKEKEEWSVLGNMALRTMKKAKYSPDNVGHFGLGLQYYTHFTAPIRRASDLKVHRQIKGVLGISGFRRNYTFEELSVYADHVSLTEERSVKCERAVQKMKAAEYMESHIGEEYEGIISSINRDGIWVQLDNLIEGLIRISEIGKDYFEYDEDLQIARGQKTGEIYRIGQKVKVIVSAASKADSEIDFTLVKKDSKDTNNKKTKNIKK